LEGESVTRHPGVREIGRGSGERGQDLLEAGVPAGQRRPGDQPDAERLGHGDQLALDAAVKDGRIRSGDLLLLEAMGGGFTWGSAVIRW
jgi:hypothetical protein